MTEHQRDEDYLKMMLEERNAELDAKEKEVEEIKKHLFSQEVIIQEQQEEVEQLGLMLEERQSVVQQLEDNNDKFKKSHANHNQHIREMQSQLDALTQELTYRGTNKDISGCWDNNALNELDDKPASNSDYQSEVSGRFGQEWNFES